jgi:protein gp37
MSKRLKAMGANGYENGFKLSILPERLEQPRKRKKPTMYFVNSMSDLFHNEIPFEFIDRVFDVMRDTPQHTYQILTKRASRMRKYFRSRKVPNNAWIGVSVENKKDGLNRIEELKNINAKVRFLSIEPLLEELGELNLSGIDWVIVGGESGPKSRPMKTEWVESIKFQCDKSNVAFFFKQWGSWGSDGVKRAKKSNGREFDGEVWNEMPMTV